MKPKRLEPLFRGLAATTAVLMTSSIVGYSVAQNYRTFVDDILGTESVRILEGEDAPFSKRWDTIEEFHANLKKHVEKQGEEGFVLMKNKNNALPLSTNKTIALFGTAS
ncbi:MAG: hypothetical protein J6Z36_00685, partial [Clostridia bacterium]|nr:hypothetical protein [Clostridia bacterium]